jgi:hypothetical protein
MVSTHLGLVRLRASTVSDRAQEALDKLVAERTERRDAFVREHMPAKKGLLFGHKERTFDEAVEFIKNDDFLSDSYAWMNPEFPSSQYVGLKQLVQVANGLLSGGDTTMEITIEAASWLYSDG